MRLSDQQEAAKRFINRRILTLQEEYEEYVGKEISPYRPILFGQFTERHRHEMTIYKEKLENLFSDTDNEEQQIDLLRGLIQLEQFLTHGISEDFERYIKMGLRIKPRDPVYNESLAWCQAKRQQGTPTTQWDYSYIKYFHIAHENHSDPVAKRKNWLNLQYSEAFRDYNTGVMKDLKHLVQLDPKPLDLKEVRCEIYKITVSFDYICKLYINKQSINEHKH